MRRRSVAGEVVALMGLAAIELVLIAAFGVMRPDLHKAMETPSFWWKLASMGLIAMLGGIVAVQSFDPSRSPRRGLTWLGAVVAVSLGTGWLIDASRGGATGTLLARLDWTDGLQCVWEMVALSVPAVIALGVLMRRGAPADGAGTALAAGLAASGWGAFVFVFACPSDDPLYIAVWYTVGCGLVTLFGRLVLPGLARW